MNKIKLLLLDEVLDRSDIRNEIDQVKVEEDDRFYVVLYRGKKIRYDVLKNEVIFDTIHRMTVDEDYNEAEKKLRFWVGLALSEDPYSLLSYYEDIIKECS